jgi:transcription factor C subunit 6
MRLRESNKRKKFRPPEYFSKLDSSSDDSRGPAEQQDSSSEEGFVDAVGDQEAIRDNDDDDNDELNNTSESELPSEVDGISNVGRRKSSAKNYSSETDGDRAAGHVQPYPSDPAAKWTRTYVGPVARHSRLPELCIHWFGDREGYENVINGFLSLWSGQELSLPRLITPEQQNLAQSPWKTENFRDDQERKFLQWYANYLATRRSPQISTAVAQSTALRWYLPQAETPLTVLLGPYDNQNEFKFHQGRSIPFSSDGLPIEQLDNTEECDGWLLDVGGIPLFMAWAPTKGKVDQLLAMTVIPYSDQEFYQNPEDAPPDATLKQGGIQIWRIPAHNSSTGIMRFAAVQPLLISALCFEWGRAVRMQWCPVPLTVRDRLGLLALLTGDGKVRVVEVKQPPNKGTNRSFGKVFSSSYNYTQAWG